MVRIRNLRKSYGSYQALRGLTMEIPRGELFGFVGPNGAGKTTTMKIIAGLMRADSGEVSNDSAAVSALNPAFKWLKKALSDNAQTIFFRLRFASQRARDIASVVAPGCPNSDAVETTLRRLACVVVCFGVSGMM